jgi:hypothetical protein
MKVERSLRIPSMSSDLTPELLNFHHFLGEKIAAGEALSPEQALDEWRLASRSEAEVEEDLAAIREALADLENGDQGVGLSDFDRDFRARHGLPRRP